MNFGQVHIHIRSLLETEEKRQVVMKREPRHSIQYFYRNEHTSHYCKFFFFNPNWIYSSSSTFKQQTGMKWWSPTGVGLQSQSNPPCAAGWIVLAIYLGDKIPSSNEGESVSHAESTSYLDYAYRLRKWTSQDELDYNHSPLSWTWLFLNKDP